MGEFEAGSAARAAAGGGPHPGGAGTSLPAPDTQAEARLPQAFRRFRLPIPVRVRVDDGRPARLTTDRHGVTGGVIVQAAGPWRTSGEWWAGESGRAPARSEAWDRDEWDIAMTDGTVYRLFVERDVGQWFLEGVVD
jgi:hypothetical protein